MVTRREDAVPTDKAKSKSHGDQDGFFIFGPGAVCVGSLLEMSRAAKELGLSMAEEQQHTAVIQGQIANDTAATIVRGGQKEAEAMKDQAAGMLTSAGLTLIGSAVTFAHGNLSGRKEAADVQTAQKVTQEMNEKPINYHTEHGPAVGELGGDRDIELADLRRQLAGKRLFVNKKPTEGLETRYTSRAAESGESYSLREIMASGRTEAESDALQAQAGKYFKQTLDIQHSRITQRQTTASTINSAFSTAGSVATGAATVYQADATQEKAKANADQAVLSADSEFVRSVMSGEAASTQLGVEGLKDSLLALRDIGRGMSA